MTINIITSAPYVISSPGNYVLGNNLSVSGDTSAITIACDDVTLDLAGYSIKSTGGAGSAGKGIGGIGSRLAIKNGQISGFYAGVWLGSGVYGDLLLATGPANVVVKDLQVDRCWFRGIRIDARGVNIKNNLITNTTGCIKYTNAFCFGVEVLGPGALVTDNIVLDTAGVGTGEGVGISLSGYGDGSVVKNNVLANTALGATNSYGIWLGGAGANQSEAYIKENIFTYWQYGFACSASNVGPYEDNTFIQCATNFLGNSAFDAGSNFIA